MTAFSNRHFEHDLILGLGKHWQSLPCLGNCPHKSAKRHSCVGGQPVGPVLRLMPVGTGFSTDSGAAPAVCPPTCRHWDFFEMWGGGRMGWREDWAWEDGGNGSRLCYCILLPLSGWKDQHRPPWLCVNKIAGANKHSLAPRRLWSGPMGCSDSHCGIALPLGVGAA